MGYLIWYYIQWKFGIEDMILYPILEEISYHIHSFPFATFLLNIGHLPALCSIHFQATIKYSIICSCNCTTLSNYWHDGFKVEMFVRAIDDQSYSFFDIFRIFPRSKDMDIDMIWYTKPFQFEIYMDINIISGFGVRYGIWYYICMKRYVNMSGFCA